MMPPSQKAPIVRRFLCKRVLNNDNQWYYLNPTVCGDVLSLSLPSDRHEDTDTMKKLLIILIVALLGGVAISQVASTLTPKEPPSFEAAISLIKSFEGMHRPKNWPYIGYGHRVLKGEGYKRGVQLTEAQADELLRKDFRKYCAMYRSFGQDSLLLAALAYNCGQGTVARSSVYKKLKEGNRDIEDAYIAHCRYRGKVMSQIKRRRQTELETLFIKELEVKDPIAQVGIAAMAAVSAPRTQAPAPAVPK